MTAAMVESVAPTRVYPRIYPTLETRSVHFVPIRPREEEEGGGGKEEEEEDDTRQREAEKEDCNKEEEKKEEEEQETEEKQEEKEEEEEEASSEESGKREEEQTEEEQTEREEQRDRDNGDESGGSNEPVTAESGNNSGPTINDQAAMNTDTETRHEKQTTTQGEASDQSNLTPREEYVDRVWEEFVTHFLLGSRHIQKAAIFDLATQRPLAMNGNLQIGAEEVAQLVASLQYLQLAYRNGITLEGRTYKVRLADGRNGILARTEREGCTVCKTHTLILIGVHDERGDSRKCNEDVMRLGDFFRKKAL